MDHFFLDFETRSHLDVRDVGAECYARHRSTQPIIMSFAVNDSEPQILTAFDDCPYYDPDQFIFVAFNAPFERAIMRHCLPHWEFPRRWLCVATMARRAGLPGSLAGAAEALHIQEQKGDKGKALIKIFSMLQKPTKKNGRAEKFFIEPHERPSEWAEFCNYCAQDVKAERDLFNQIGPEIITPAESDAIDRNWRANELGIYVDALAIDNAIGIVASEEANACEMLSTITGGQITTPGQVQRIAQFCGVKSVTAAAVKDAIADPEIGADECAVLRIRQDVGKSSVKKLLVLRDRITDGRVRDLTIYHGAHTGRETGVGPQPLNMPKGKFTGDYGGLCGALDMIRSNDAKGLRAKHGSVMGAVSGSLRGMFTATPGKEFFCCDMASIEARLVFWFAGESAVLQAYREGADLYKHLASTIYKKRLSDVTKAEREVGKRGILGLGFGMGASRFKDSVKQYAGIDIDLDLAETAKTAYRRKYFRVPRMWQAIETAARNAIVSGGPHKTNRITYRRDRKWLVCSLPSGRDLYYYGAGIDEDQSISHMGMVASSTGKRTWKRDATYGGKLTENFVQATARDLLQCFMAEIERRGYTIVLTVYDEILCERTIGEGSLDEIVSIMSAPPAWCADLPLAAEGWKGDRYRK